MTRRSTNSSTIRIAVVAMLVLIVSSVRANNNHLDGLLIMEMGGTSIEQTVAHVDRALAPSLQIAKAPASPQSDCRSGDGARAASLPTPGITAIALRTNMLDAAPPTHWVSIERPTRDRARLMVFLN